MTFHRIPQRCVDLNQWPRGVETGRIEAQTHVSNMLGASPSETYTQILYIEIIVQKLTSTKYLRSTWRNQHQPQHLQPN